MITFVFSLFLTFALALSLRGTLTTQGRMVLVGFDGVGVLLAFGCFIVISAFLGTAIAVSVLFALFVYELGQSLARRSLGAAEPELRLIPLPFLSQTARRSEPSVLAECYVALMGAALSLAPLTMAFAGAQMIAPYNRPLAEFALTLGVTIGTVNFIMLLPFVPLDGGRCVRAFAASLWPGFGTAFTVFMVAAFASAALRFDSMALLVLAGIGLQALLPRKAPTQPPMGANATLLVMAAYAFTLAAHFAGGWWLIKGMI